SLPGEEDEGDKVVEEPISPNPDYSVTSETIDDPNQDDTGNTVDNPAGNDSTQHEQTQNGGNTGSTPDELNEAQKNNQLDKGSDDDSNASSNIGWTILFIGLGVGAVSICCLIYVKKRRY
ncbi:MAG: hypothetical protein LBE09_01565, partial [Christensenellaceae bacterium]|nr:hypothetical protein [Christensenellaceae bacterium]